MRIMNVKTRGNKRPLRLPTASLHFRTGLLLALFFVHSVTSQGLAGPFRIVPDHVEACPPELEGHPPIVHRITARRDRHNPELFYFTVNITTPHAYDDTRDAEGTLASWSSRGGWKENAFVFRAKKFCSACRNGLGSLWRSLMKGFFGDPNHPCPVPPGSYYVPNVTYDVHFKYVPVFFYGKWRVTFRMLTADAARRTLGCIRGYGATVPRNP